MEEIIYFELDNWSCGENYPAAEPFISWMKDDLNLQFSNPQWCKENKLCVRVGHIDMSVCFCISAPKTWIEATCPMLLTDEECGSFTYVTSVDKDTKQWVTTKKYHSKKYSDFVCHPNKTGTVYGRLSGWEFLEYTEENFGTWYYEEEEDYDE